LRQSDDDVALHAGIIAGQVEALEMWEERYRRRLMNAGIRDGLSVEEAEEAWFSQVLPTVWHKAATIEPVGSGLMRYSFGIMRTQARSQRRVRATLPGTLEDTHEANPLKGEPMPAYRRDAVRRCLEVLPSRDRLLVELLYMERVDATVVAEQVGVLPRSIQRAGERAKQKIRPCLEEALDV
jgi:DNA-directed RNA polymerase specialized sigma24 family protein